MAVKAINIFSKLSPYPDTVLILDDSTLPKRGKSIELVSWVYDAVLKKSTLGFKPLVLGWSECRSFDSIFASSAIAFMRYIFFLSLLMCFLTILIGITVIKVFFS